MDIQQAASAYNAAANITQNNPAPSSQAVSSSSDPSFSDLVSSALANAVDQGHKAEDVSTLALMGKADINELAIAVSNAELALDTVVAVRDKVVSAYQQIMQMSI
jgi:flagellar hook-basal body complex protein FliE